LLLTFSRLSYRDDTDRIALIGVDDCNNPSFHDAKRDEALLAIVQAVVLDGRRETLEKRLNANEIDPVLAKVLLAFGLIPLHLHKGECSYPM
jgi:hypothetical protein